MLWMWMFIMLLHWYIHCTDCTLQGSPGYYAWYMASGTLGEVITVFGSLSRVTCHVSRAEAGYENWPGMEWWERFSGGLAWPPNMEEEDMNWN